ncbi:hypothetical protein DUK53_16110 [Listeria sp. SHR_NRA_18]|uniref:hypothetical protein n=1 Tax=Listeria sp. SHR_NRA_18 TaxID=2269046 RepID=UPI000F5E43DF|nr:hypothetical protein [Listeria sp. SHR_NRA_18]RQW65475.1 hypothetical protein DUK53_16110 [Listeria sp. SHR_NRA_18]
MITVKRFNKVLSIDETEKSTYTALGYDVVELDEKKKEYKVVEYAAGNDKIDKSKYEKLESQIKEHKEKYAALEKEHQELQDGYKELKEAYQKIAK